MTSASAPPTAGRSKSEGSGPTGIAEKWLNQTIAAVDRGEILGHSETFASYFDRWLTEHKPRLEAGTHADYEVHGRLRLKPYFGSQRLAAITPSMIRQYVAERVDSGAVSNKTINNSLGVLRVALGHAEEDGLIARNPAATKQGARERIKLPEEHREVDYLRLYEIPIYLAACDRVYRPLAEALIATGLRISEALELRWADVDWEARVFRVYRSGKWLSREMSDLLSGRPPPLRCTPSHGENVPPGPPTRRRRRLMPERFTLTG